MTAVVPDPPYPSPGPSERVAREQLLDEAQFLFRSGGFLLFAQ
jgi:hypothetical protein